MKQDNDKVEVIDEYIAPSTPGKDKSAGTKGDNSDKLKGESYGNYNSEEASNFVKNIKKALFYMLLGIILFLVAIFSIDTEEEDDTQEEVSEAEYIIQEEETVILGTDIKDAYKKLVKRWHPDRFIQDGEQAVHRAEEKTKEINKAYDLICQHRGMK